MSFTTRITGLLKKAGYFTANPTYQYNRIVSELKTYKLKISILLRVMAYFIQRTGLTDWTRGLDSAKLLIIPLHLFRNHLIHFVRITGIACAFEPRFARYSALFEKRKPTLVLKPAIFNTAVS